MRKINNYKKILSVLMCGAMMVSIFSGCAAKTAQANTDVADTENNSTVSLAPLSATGDKLSKDETVYVMCSSSGDVSKIIVSDWIKNGTKQTKINDKTDLKDITVTKGNTEYTMDQNNMTVWNADSGDVYYQGNSNKTSLPVDLSVSYKLDGKSISAEDLAGKSGKVTIHYDYKNNQYEDTDIGGKKERIYVPFVMMSGLILDNSIFSNVEVTNGRTVKSGDNTIAIGFALPGMQEDLGVSKKDVDIPDSFEITADVTNFSLSNSLTMATNEVFSNIDTSSVSNLEDLKSQMNTLEDSMTKLADGSSDLYTGLQTLLEKSNEIVSSMNEMSAAVSQLSAGASSIYDGAVSLRDNLTTLKNGLGDITANNDKLNGGAQQIFEQLLAQADTSLSAAGLDKMGISVPSLTISNYDSVLENIIAALGADNVYRAAYNSALSTVTESVNSHEDEIEAGVTAKVRENVLAGVTDGYKSGITDSVTANVKANVESGVNANADNIYTAAVYKSILDTMVAGGTTQSDAEAYLASSNGQAAIAQGVSTLTDSQKQAILSAAVDAQMSSDSIKSTIDSNVQSTLSSATIQDKISADTDNMMLTDSIKQKIAELVAAQKQQLINENMASTEVTSQISAAVASASAGAASIVTLKGNLDQYNAFYIGLAQYTEKVSEAYSGCCQIEAGSETLANYIKTLSDNLDKLDSVLKAKSSEIKALPDGVSQLKDGAQQISQGINDVNDLGIKKLVDLVNGDLTNLVDRFNATVKVSKNYNNYSGLSNNMDGTVKFVYKTDSIG